MKLTPATPLLLPTGEIEQLQAKAILRLRTSSEDRAKWSNLLLHADRELTRRRKGQEARRGRSRPLTAPAGAQADPGVGHRLLDAHNGLYQSGDREAIRQRAAQVREKMTSAPMPRPRRAA